MVVDEFFAADMEIRSASKSSNWKCVESGGLSTPIAGQISFRSHAAPKRFKPGHCIAA
jgi:hypothetical protein